MNQPIQAIRHAARLLVRELHLLDGRVECCGLPMSECHLITQLATLGEATASELCERLVLEKSTMSRLVNRLVDKGLVCAACCEDDRRTRILCLTGKGKEQAARLDRRANGQVESALDFLTAGEARTVLEGLERYAGALRRARLASSREIPPIPPGEKRISEARQL